MALKTIHVVQGLSRTPLLFFLDVSPQDFPTHILHLYRPRISYVLSHRIVKSLTFRIFGKLKFQCTRNGPKSPPYCAGSIQDAFIIVPRYLTTRFSKNIWPKKEISEIGNLQIWKSKNPGSLTSAQVIHP